MAKLYVLSGDDVGRTYEVTGDRTVLGRGNEADVVVRGLSVSRRHARIERTADGWRLVDLGSSNGIRLGGMKVTAGDLIDGEIFYLGDVELRFRIEDVPSAPIAPQDAATQTRFVPPSTPPSTPAPVEENFDLEGDWDIDAPVEVHPVRSAPKPKPRPAPAQEAKASAARRAEALGGTGVGAVREATGGKRVLQYHKVENRSGLLSADLDQQGSTTRWLLYTMVMMAFVALAYGAYTLTAATKRTATEMEDEFE